jgi:hypothetical protein
MRYQPVNALDRKHIGKFWNKNALRIIQVMLIPTHGVVGIGKDSLKVIWGETEEQFLHFIEMTEEEKLKGL